MMAGLHQHADRFLPSFKHLFPFGKPSFHHEAVAVQATACSATESQTVAWPFSERVVDVSLAHRLAPMIV